MKKSSTFLFLSCAIVGFMAFVTAISPLPAVAAISKYPTNAEFEQIYSELQPADFEYIFSLDPFQAEEYTKYMVAPYPLLRTGVDFFFKGTQIPAGYYLLTPREKNGVKYVLFKQEGKVKYIIPTYKTELVDPLFYQKHVPTPKKTTREKIGGFMDKFASKVSRNSKRTAPPKSYIDVNEIGREFWEVVLYYGNEKYFLLFRQQK